MLVYEKKAADGRHLYGTMGHVPADEDVKLTYKDKNGAEIQPVAKDTYRDDKKGGIIRESDGKAVNVFIGNECIIGKVEATVNAVQPEVVKAEVKAEPKKKHKEEVKAEAVVEDEVKEEVL